jgi:hypothetical protein
VRIRREFGGLRAGAHLKGLAGRKIVSGFAGNPRSPQGSTQNRSIGVDAIAYAKKSGQASSRKLRTHSPAIFMTCPLPQISH